MMSSRLTAVVAATFLFSAVPSLRADDAAVTLARTFKVGQVFRYKADTTFSINLQGNDAEGTRKHTESTTVKEIKANGDIVFAFVMGTAHVSVAGMEFDSPESEPVMITRDKLGKLLKLEHAPEGIMTAEVLQLMSSLDWVIFPDKPVKPGDSWETEFDNPAVKGKKFTVKTTFVGTEKVNGADLWKFKSTATADSGLDNGKIEHENTSWVDPALGVAVKLETVQKKVPIQYGPLTSNIKSELVKDDKEKK